jgi:hypothetical protein
MTTVMALPLTMVAVHLLIIQMMAVELAVAVVMIAMVELAEEQVTILLLTAKSVDKACNRTYLP